MKKPRPAISRAIDWEELGLAGAGGVGPVGVGGGVQEMGLGGLLASPPRYVSASSGLGQSSQLNAAQHAAAAQAAQNSLGAQMYPGYVGPPNQQAARPPDRVVMSVAPQATKAATKISQALEQLPMRLAGQILSINFVEKLDANFKVTGRVFMVTYTNNRTLEFGDVDSFPSEADIARIALECP